MKYTHRILQLLALFTMVPILVVMVTESLKTHLIWYFRLVDFIDLLIIAPFYLVMLLLFYEVLIEEESPHYLRMCFFVFSGVFLYAHAMHVTANAINTFSTEIRDYASVLPADTYALIYFLDETLSHILAFISLYGLFICLLIFENLYLDLSLRQWKATSSSMSVSLGVLYGVAQGIAFAEAGKVILVPFVVILTGGFWFWLWKRCWVPLAHFVRTGPVTAFIAGLLPGLLMTLLVYALILRGFPQPSQLGF